MFLWGWAAKRGGGENKGTGGFPWKGANCLWGIGNMEPMSNSVVRCEGNGKTVPSRDSQSGWYNRRAGWYIRRFYNGKIRFRSKMANISGWMIYPVDDITGVYCITFQPILSSRQSYCMSSRSRVEMHGLSALPISEPHFLSFLCILRLPINFIQTFFYSIS